MPVLPSREVTVAISGVAVVVALSTAAAMLAPPSSDELTPGSSFSHGADGSAAAYLTLQSLGYRVARSFEAVATLRPDPPSTVLILASPQERASEGDRRALLALAAAGATVLVAGCEGSSFLAEGGGGAASATGDARVFAAALPSALAADAPRISMETGCLQFDPGSRYTTLYGDDREAAVRFARVGQGVVIWWAGATPIANRAIGAPGHLELLLNVVGPPGRTILWDEFYHGQRRSLLSYAKLTPLPWLAAQVGLVALVAAAMFFRRRAPVLDRFVEPRTAPLEFVETMAGLYARAAAAGDAIATARARLRRLLLDATGLEASVDDARLAAVAAGRIAVDPGELGAVLRESASAAASRLETAQHALPLVRRLQALASAIEKRGG